MNRVFLSLLLKSYRHNKFSVLMLVVSLTIAVTGLATVLIINQSAKQSYNSVSTLLVNKVRYQVVAKNSSKPLQKQDYVMLRRHGFDELVAVAQQKSHIYIDKTRITNRRIEFTGIDGFAFTSFVNGQSTNKTDNGSTNQNSTSLPIAGIFNNNNAVLHPNLYANIFGQKNSDKKAGKNKTGASTHFFAKDTQTNAYAKLPPLNSLHEASLGNDIVMDISAFYRLFPKADLSMLMFVSAQSPANINKRIALLKARLPAHLEAIPISEGQSQGEMTESFHLNLMAMALLMFVVCLFIVLNAVNLTIANRMPWLKVCRQLGIRRRSIFATQIMELILLTAICCVLGIYLSVHLANFVSPAVQATLEDLYAVELGFGKPSLLSLFIKVFSISVIGTVLATLFSFSQSNKRLANIKDDVQQSATANSLIFWAMFVVFTIASFALLFFVHSLWLLLTATAMLILSGCSLLLANYPHIINLLFKCVPSSYPLLQLSVKQSAALSARTKVACCAFFIAATSNIGMNLMVDSFRGATVSWLETRLVSDYYLFYEGEKNIAELAEQANIELFQRFENQVDYQGLTIQQFSYPTSTVFKNAMVFYAIDDTQQAWHNFEKGRGVFVNQQFAFHYQVSLNDTVILPEPKSSQMTEYIIQGIIYDFGNTFKQVLLPLSAFDPEISPSKIYSINATPSELTVFRELLENHGINHQRNLINTEQLLAISTNAFDRTFLITDGLNIVTLLIAALSLACAIIILMNTVRAENMLIRSLGVSAFKTQALALFQYSFLCIIALLFATPFGILLSYVLIFEINLQAFQWTYPLQIDALKILRVYFISLAVVIMIIAIPIIKASKKPLIEDIRWLQ